jgi:hypothetical protein
MSEIACFRHLSSKLCRNKRIKFYVRRRRVLTGGRLWAVIALFSVAFFLVAFSLAKITSSYGSRWDISWTAVAGVTAAAAAIVSLLTLFDSGRKG